ncbi:MAG: hypothetical protein QOE12_546 [Mycobacterium sp.]|jgi:hypothetical protein|nr:hypothetical protein [Mycobacterium sp.]
MSITGTHSRSVEKPTLARVLAAASLGLGATELLAPTLVSNVSGVAPTRGVRNVIRALGVRELAHGFALSASPASAWTRVAGDVLDVALLAVGHRTHSANDKRGLVAAGLLTGIAGLDVIASRRYAGAFN